MRRLNAVKGRFDRNFPPEDRGIEAPRFCRAIEEGRKREKERKGMVQGVPQSINESVTIVG